MLRKMLPKTVARQPGTVLPQYIRCGKPACRCATGELHGPYFYRFWRDEDGRLRKVYVRRADLDEVRAACEARQEDARRARTILTQGRAALAWLERDVPMRSRGPENVEPIFAHPAALYALLRLARDEDADLKFQMRAARSLAAWLSLSRDAKHKGRKP